MVRQRHHHQKPQEDPSCPNRKRPPHLRKGSYGQNSSWSWAGWLVVVIIGAGVLVVYFGYKGEEKTTSATWYANMQISTLRLVNSSISKITSLNWNSSLKWNLPLEAWNTTSLNNQLSVRQPIPEHRQVQKNSVNLVCFFFVSHFLRHSFSRCIECNGRWRSCWQCPDPPDTWRMSLVKDAEWARSWVHSTHESNWKSCTCACSFGFVIFTKLSFAKCMMTWTGGVFCVVKSLSNLVKSSLNWDLSLKLFTKSNVDCVQFIQLLHFSRHIVLAVSNCFKRDITSCAALKHLEVEFWCGTCRWDTWV